MKGDKNRSFFKRLVRFMFIGIWEAAYNRKRNRELFRPPMHYSHRPDTERSFDRRYRWIRKKMD